VRGGKVGAVLREILDTLVWARRSRAPGDAVDRELAGLVLLEKLGAVVAPTYLLTEGAKSWSQDADFMRAYRRLEPRNLRSAERKFVVRTLVAAVAQLRGDSVEAGVYFGGTSWFICDTLAGTGKVHHAFDSFEGLSAPDAVDGTFWSAGDLRADEASVRRLLAPYPVRIHRGWVPEVFAGVALGELCFAHVDVDLYEATLGALEYFYHRLVPGGMLVCDDYGFTTCPGATRAVDEFMAGRPEPIIHLPTGQGLVIRRG
jgi:O-methyltransferase